MKQHKQIYAQLATSVAEYSYAPDKKVGAVIVQGDLMAYSYNGTVPGSCNDTVDDEGRTLNSVLHAEASAIAKFARSGIPTYGAELYCTLSPCMDCAKIIFLAGISKVYCKEVYKHGNEALDFLRNAGVTVQIN
jgi:dCMP deaminase